MNSKEIARLAAWTARAIRDTITESGRELDAAGEDIIREYVQTSLTKWQRGEKVSAESLSELITEIFQRRRHETQTDGEVINSLMVLAAKFPSFVEQNQRARDEEARKIASGLPAVKV